MEDHQILFPGTNTESFMDMLFFTSFVDEVAREKLTPFSALSGDESFQSRDLEKVNLRSPLR